MWMRLTTLDLLKMYTGILGMWHGTCVLIHMYMCTYIHIVYCINIHILYIVFIYTYIHIVVVV